MKAIDTTNQTAPACPLCKQIDFKHRQRYLDGEEKRACLSCGAEYECIAHSVFTTHIPAITQGE